MVDVRRGPALAVALLVLTGITACGDNDGNSRSDCSVRVRFHGTAYQEVGFSSVAATKRSTSGELAGCNDRGNENGPTFDKGVSPVDVWTFRGHDQREVIGLRMDDDLYRVLAPTGTSEADLQALHRSGLLNAGAQ